MFNWRAIPLALRCALILEVISLSAWMLFDLVDSPKYVEQFFLTYQGLGFVVKVMGSIGALDFARTLTGRAAIGAKIAFAGYLVAVGLTVAWAILSCKSSWMSSSDVRWVLHNGSFATDFAILVGLAIAVTNVGLAIVGVVVGFATSPPPFLWRLLAVAQPRGHDAIRGGMEAINIATLIVLAGYAARTQIDTSDPQRAVHGFRSAARSMWLRIIAVAVVPGLTLLLVIGGGGKDAQEILQLTMMAALVVGLSSLTQFGVGVVAVARSRLADMSQLSMLLSGCAALWCAGVLLEQIPHLYHALYGRDLYGLGGDYTEALSIVAPLVAVGAIGLLVGAIAGFAGRRGFNDLHTRASSKGVAFVILMFATIAIQQWVLPRSSSVSSFLFMTLCMLVASLVATVMVANLCTQAAEAVDREPRFPTATVL